MDLGEGIQKLNDYQHVRLRTEMYLGSREVHANDFVILNEDGLKVEEIEWVPAIWSAFREILDNALDEVVSHGYGNRIDVSYDEQNVFTIEDNGRGIPVKFVEKENEYIPTIVFTHMKSGRNFGQRRDVSGTNGIGACVVNFCSKFMELKTVHDGVRFHQKFREGLVTEDLITEKPSIRKVSAKNSGTQVVFKLSERVFRNYIFSVKLMESHLRFLAFFNRNVHFYLNGKRIVVPKNADELFGRPASYLKIDKKDTSIEVYIIPEIQTGKDFYYSMVNNISVFDNGKHVDSFKKSFFGKLAEYVNKKYKNINVSRNLLCKDIVVLFNIKTKEAFFDSQSKTRFVNDLPSFDEVIDDKFIKRFATQHQNWIQKIVDEIVETKNDKESNELKKEFKKLKKKKSTKLIDATSANRKDCILFITEGDSALSNLIAVRNPRIHAGYPLRGKIPNASKMKAKDILDNHELAELMKIIGLDLFEKAERSKLRYKSVYIAHDADHDGYNIGSLILNFFYKYWPELFDPKQEPYFYVFQTPLIIAEKGNERHYWYMTNYHEFDSSKWKGYSITRAKGLGSLTLEHWKDCLQNPYLTPLINDEKLEYVLDMIFNPEKTDLRKQWISGEYEP